MSQAAQTLSLTTLICSTSDFLRAINSGKHIPMSATVSCTAELSPPNRLMPTLVTIPLFFGPAGYHFLTFPLLPCPRAVFGVTVIVDSPDAPGK